MRLFSRAHDHHRRSSDHEGRLSIVETKVASLDARVEKGFGDLSSKLDDMAQGNKTDWSVVIAAVGMMLTIMILAFTPLIYKMQENSEDIKDHRDVLKDTSVDIAIIKSKIEED